MTEIESGFLKVFVGFLLGAGLTYWRTKYTVYSSDFFKRIEFACCIIDDYAECSCRYWSNLKESDELKSNIHYVTGLQHRLSTFLTSMDRDYSGFKVNSIKEALHELNNECTGGNFKNNTKIDEYKITAILNLAEELKAELFKIRHLRY